MYIAINIKTFRINPIRAMRFAVRSEDFIKLLEQVLRKENYEDYVYFYVR